MKKTLPINNGSGLPVRCGRAVLLFLFFFIAVFLVDRAFAFDIGLGQPFSLNHPDKKVSPLAAAMDDDGRIYAGWVRDEGRLAVYVASSSDGKVFSSPVAVSDPSSAPGGMHQPPAVAVGPRGEVYVAWSSARTDGEFSADIRFARSIDGGKTFEKPIKVNSDPAPASRGFESMAVNANGNIYIAWLDGRDKKPGVSATYMTRSVDSGRSFEKEAPVDGGSCPCCRTAVAAGKDGSVYVSWRKVYKDDIREIVVSSTKDGGRSFSGPFIVGKDNWSIAGCPHRGPSIAAGPDGRIHAAWYTEGEESLPAIYYGLTADGGRSFTKKKLPWAQAFFPDHPVLALDRNGRPVAAWEETTPVLSKVFLQYNGEKRQLNQGVRRARDPVVFVNGKGRLLAGWAQEEIKYTRFVFMTGDIVDVPEAQ